MSYFQKIVKKIVKKKAERQKVQTFVEDEDDTQGQLIRKWLKMKNTSTIKITIIIKITKRRYHVVKNLTVTLEW